MKMWVYIIRRCLLLIPVVIGVMTITFVLVNAVPIPSHILAYLGPTRAPCGYNPTCPPGSGPCPTNSPVNCTNPTYTRAVHQLGLDQPIPVQWGRYIYDSLTLNWGYTDPHSTAAVFAGTQDQSVPVLTVLSWYLPYTLELAAIALTLILLLAIPVGNYSAVYRNRPFDQGARVLSFSGFAFPGFLLAVLLLFAAVVLSGGISTNLCNHLATPYDLWFGSWPDQNCMINGVYPSWVGYSNHYHTSPTGFPTIDAVFHALTDSGSQYRAQDWYLAGESVKRLLLPAFAIAFGSVALILRFVRNSMLEVMNLDFVRTARAKGVPEAVVVSKHAGRNSLNVTITVLGLVFAAFVGGFPVYESVFGIKGIGQLLVQAVNPAMELDYGLIFGTTLLFTFIVVIANIIVDILYAYLDPRVRLG
ncbi:MAG TPA: ABC transporter permease [Thermoplasmata archaeon]|nr:ABC transporter permease [Thermoplasmata archaeon]